MLKSLSILCTSAVATTLLLSAPPAVASGGDGEVANQGRCDGGARWKVKAKPDDGRLEVEGEVDSNQSGQTWAWRIKRDGEVVSRGTAQTRGPSGSFSIERRVADGPGRDRIAFLAERRGGSQSCRGSVTV